VGSLGISIFSSKISQYLLKVYNSCGIGVLMLGNPSRGVRMNLGTLKSKMSRANFAERLNMPVLAKRRAHRGHHGMRPCMPTAGSKQGHAICVEGNAMG
jgi:hypothetical protein